MWLNERGSKPGSIGPKNRPYWTILDPQSKMSGLKMSLMIPWLMFVETCWNMLKHVETCWNILKSRTCLHHILGLSKIPTPSSAPCWSGGPSVGPVMVWDLPAPVPLTSWKSSSKHRVIYAAAPKLNHVGQIHANEIKALRQLKPRIFKNNTYTFKHMLVHQLCARYTNLLTFPEARSPLGGLSAHRQRWSHWSLRNCRLKQLSLSLLGFFLWCHIICCYIMLYNVLSLYIYIYILLYIIVVYHFCISLLYIVIHIYIYCCILLYSIIVM